MARKRYVKRRSTGRKRRVYKKTSRVRRAPAKRPRKMVRGTDDYYNNPTLLLGLQRDYKTRPERATKRSPLPPRPTIKEEPTDFQKLGRFAVDSIYRNLNIPRVFGLTDDKTPEFVKSIFPDFYKNQDGTEKELMQDPNKFFNPFLTWADGQRRPGDLKPAVDFVGHNLLKFVGIPDLSDQVPFYKEAKELYDGGGLEWLKKQKEFLLSDDNQKLLDFAKDFTGYGPDSVSHEKFYDYFSPYLKNQFRDYSPNLPGHVIDSLEEKKDRPPVLDAMYSTITELLYDDTKFDIPTHLMDKYKEYSRKDYVGNFVDTAKEQSMKLVHQLPYEVRNVTLPDFVDVGLDRLSDLLDDYYNTKTTLAPEFDGDGDHVFTPVKRPVAPWKPHFGDEYINESKKVLPTPRLEYEKPSKHRPKGFKELFEIPSLPSETHFPPPPTTYPSRSLDYEYIPKGEYIYNKSTKMSNYVRSGYYNSKTGQHSKDLPSGYHINYKNEIVYDDRPVVTKDTSSLPRGYFK